MAPSKECKNKVVSRKRSKTGNILENGGGTSNQSKPQPSRTKHSNDKSSNKSGTSKADSDNFSKPPLLEELEEEIERQLEAKAKKNNMTATNVKNIIKAVLTSEDVVNYMDFNLNLTKERPPYEITLTRAKLKELMAKESITVWPLQTPTKKSDIAELINKELPDDSSDEEYHPTEEASDDESKLDESDLSSSPEKVFQNRDQNHVKLLSQNEDVSTKQENVTSAESVCQRTRSKLSLSATSLEALEQAFVPPDITMDMYNTNCENQDWLDFLKEFTQPLTKSLDAECNENNDDENDPEYNVMVDVELEGLDLEELRMDRAVKITKKEFKDLMNETYEYSQSISSDEDDQVTKRNYVKEINNVEHNNFNVSNCQANLDESSFKNKTLIQKEEVKYDNQIIFKEQRLLIEQQLRQHIQLLVSHFLLSYQHPYLDENFSNNFKSMLLFWEKVAKNNEASSHVMFNLEPSLVLMRKWASVLNNPLYRNKVNSCLLTEINKVRSEKNKRKYYRPKLPSLLMKLCSKSSAFTYPLLMPSCGFLTEQINNTAVFNAEVSLILMGLDKYESTHGEINIHNSKNFYRVLKFVRAKNIPAWTTQALYRFIKRSLASDNPNPIKKYFKNSSLPETAHYVVPIQNKQIKLCDQHPELVPDIWLPYLNSYKN